MFMDDKSSRNFSQSFVLTHLNKPRSYFILNDVLRFHAGLPKETIVAVESSLKSDLDDDFPIVVDISSTLIAPSEMSFLNIANYALNDSDAPFKAASVSKFVEKNDSQIDQAKSIHVANLAIDVKPKALGEVFKKFELLDPIGLKLGLTLVPNFKKHKSLIRSVYKIVLLHPLII
ncbi:Nuclear transport factor 2 [Corchorus olitorius]|uniref:Nuclear transport factor 2 n=1 Tax=Corchorus olitorius TaxID=93759 RepID=A0A1R3G7Z1_9ROSI|nr:Nuclear transport factor 2 [Corchorus olitorius]